MDPRGYATGSRTFSAVGPSWEVHKLPKLIHLYWSLRQSSVDKIIEHNFIWVSLITGLLITGLDWTGLES